MPQPQPFDYNGYVNLYFELQSRSDRIPAEGLDNLALTIRSPAEITSTDGSVVLADRPRIFRTLVESDVNQISLEDAVDIVNKSILNKRNNFTYDSLQYLEKIFDGLNKLGFRNVEFTPEWIQSAIPHLETLILHRYNDIFIHQSPLESGSCGQIANQVMHHLEAGKLKSHPFVVDFTKGDPQSVEYKHTMVAVPIREPGEKELKIIVADCFSEMTLFVLTYSDDTVSKLLPIRIGTYEYTNVKKVNTTSETGFEAAVSFSSQLEGSLKPETSFTGICNPRLVHLHHHTLLEEDLQNKNPFGINRMTGRRRTGDLLFKEGLDQMEFYSGREHHPDLTVERLLSDKKILRSAIHLGYTEKRLTILMQETRHYEPLLKAYYRGLSNDGNNPLKSSFEWASHQ